MLGGIHMTVQQLIEHNVFRLISKGDALDRTVDDIFCCDLLSIAMSRASAGSAWVTVMANVNTLAVASLADISVIILAEGVSLDLENQKRAEEQGITVLATEESVYHAAKVVDQLIHETDNV